ncbi:NrsF family protein [Leptospira ilyithenensis]|uniref:DUF1109 family protein n=1 Tax=Leptospira ilyithenensis TaxID=2484901 RepID=A0A4R9LUZ0_9LEPT|nr:NrsF family protein [Leptospira ilyithenensis]TGN13117.1 DUF1109 family protein [Leptospira ilyithenensis]
MKTLELIEILTQDNKKIRVLKSPFLRFLTWALFSVLSIFVILVISTVIRGQYHIPKLWESILTLAVVFVSCGLVLYERNIPGKQFDYGYLFHNLILLSWFCFLIITATFTEKGLFAGLSENWKSHGPGCAEVVLLMTIIPVILLNLHLRKGFVEPTFLFQFSAFVLPFTLAQMAISFLCADETAAHILVWHTLVSLPFYSLIFFPIFKLIQPKVLY